MKKILILLITIFLSLNIHAQHQCTTPACKPPAWMFSTSAKSANTTTVYNLNVFIHIVRSDNGSGLSFTIRNTILSLLNSSYSDANIQFSLLGSDYIDNDDYYYELKDSEIDLLFSENAHCNAIDIYVLGENTSFGGAAGRADGLFSTAFIVGGDFYDTSTLPHEMGHCLGLYHTFHGTDPDAGTDDPDRCAELVDGTNSDTCGDYIVDTPADPNDFSGTSCTYNGTLKDTNDDLYTPDGSNYMSYAYRTCRTNFTNGQIERMRDAIVNTDLLQNTIAADFSGPSVLCSSSATYNLENLPSTVTSIDWNHGPFLTISSGENEEECVISSTGNGSSWVQPVLVMTGCGTMPLPRLDVYVGRPNPADITIVDLGPNYPGSMILCDDMPNDGKLKWDHPGSILEYDWSIYDDGGNTWQVNQHPNDPFPDVPMKDVQFSKPYGSVNGYVNVILKARNGCGWGNYLAPAMQFSTSSCGGMVLMMAPNPSSGETTLSIEPEETREAILKSASTQSSFDKDVEWEYEVYSNMQSLKAKKTKIKGKSTQLNTQSWKEGVYTVRAKYKDHILTGKLLVKH